MMRSLFNHSTKCLTKQLLKNTATNTNTPASIFRMRLVRNLHIFLYKPVNENIPYVIGICKYHSKSYRKNGRRNIMKDNCLNVTRYNILVSQLPARFDAEDLCKVLGYERDPYVCLELFKFVSQKSYFKHDVSSYRSIVEKLGNARFYEEMDVIVKEVFAIRTVGSEELFNEMIYFYLEGKMVMAAANVFRHMRNCSIFGCRPTIRTYNLLFQPLLEKGNNTFVNRMYMDTIRCLFKQMVDDLIEPDILSLNCMIKGYTDSLQVDDALRIFHQMGVVYICKPDWRTYGHIVWGLCCQGRTTTALELYEEMKEKGFVLNVKPYKALVNSLAIARRFEDAVKILWEMIERGMKPDFITYHTVIDEICRHGNVEEAKGLLMEFQKNYLVDSRSYKKLLSIVEDELRISDD